MKTIALIPARSGSKGIPGKNLRLLGGKPLIEWSIDVALQVGGLDRLVVSAGNAEIERVARDAGAEAYIRPQELNGDDTPMIDVVRDAIEYCGLEDDDIIVLLQPTAPFRSVESVRRCVFDLQSLVGLESCLTRLRVPDRFHPDQIIDGSLRYPVNRQELTAAYVRAGTVYAFYVGVVQEYGNIYGEVCAYVEVPEAEALNLDEMSDWHEAERRVKNRTTEATQPPSVQGEQQAQQAAL